MCIKLQNCNNWISRRKHQHLQTAENYENGTGYPEIEKGQKESEKGRDDAVLYEIEG